MGLLLFAIKSLQYNLPQGLLRFIVLKIMKNRSYVIMKLNRIIFALTICTGFSTQVSAMFKPSSWDRSTKIDYSTASSTDSNVKVPATLFNKLGGSFAGLFVGGCLCWLVNDVAKQLSKKKYGKHVAHVVRVVGYCAAISITAALVAHSLAMKDVYTGSQPRLSYGKPSW